MKKIFFFIFCYELQNMNAHQAIYPVTDFDNGKKIMVVYQKSLTDMQLWCVDTQHNRSIQLISSFLIPANVRMIPSGKGFSFIDQGFIKIKEFEKRSPKTLALYEPISNFSSMNWMNDQLFYFVARQGNYFQIFQADLESNVQQLTDQSAHALYPQKIDADLFYIQKKSKSNYTICKQRWNPKNIGLGSTTHHITLLQETNAQLCCLYMKNSYQGYYLQVQPHTQHPDLYEFICCSLLSHNDLWQSTELFTFCIPSRYIHGPDQLYESIEPFLPNYTQSDYIYFVDYQQRLDHNQAFKFDIATKSKILISDQIINIQYKNRENIAELCAPYITDNKLYFGLILPEKKSCQQLTDMIQEKNNVLQLPYITLKK